MMSKKKKILIGVGVFFLIGVIGNINDSSNTSTNTTTNTTVVASATAEPTKSPEKTRRELLEANFSAWDGSHRQLTKYIKDNMNDPSSYEHVETTFRDDTDYILVRTKFRGKNGFGGVVLDSVTAKTSIDGDILEIVE